MKKITSIQLNGDYLSIYYKVGNTLNGDKKIVNIIEHEKQDILDSWYFDVMGEEEKILCKVYGNNHITIFYEHATNV